MTDRPLENNHNFSNYSMILNLIRNSIRSIVGTKGPPVAFLEPAGDPGLFGPNSVAWLVHEDFISMMIGGISSLVLQSLHPRVLAGVWDHSTFREDLQGRLGRTAFFIAATTYGSTEMATRAIEKVKQIHSKVSGIDELGQSYSATDPHLLGWVHLTETRSFMSACESYHRRNLTQSQKDQYVREMTSLGAMMGASHLPDSYRNTEIAIASYRQELHFGERAQSIIQLLENFPSTPATRPFLKLLCRAGFMNLPDWVYPFIKKRKPGVVERLAVQKSINLMAVPVRRALKDGVAAHARRRVSTSALV